MLTAIRSLYAYNAWANERILATADRITQDQYLADAGEGSIRDTLVHTAAAQWLWLQRWLGASPPADFDFERERAAALAELAAAGDAPVVFRPRRLPRLRVWIPGDDSPVDVTDVMEHIRELDRAYDVQGISYDPRFFDVPAKMLSDEGLPLVEVPQSVDGMTRVCGGLLELIKRGEVHHDGAPARGREGQADAREEVPQRRHHEGRREEALRAGRLGQQVV